MIALGAAISHWNTQMIGGSWDSGLTIWNFWWVDKSIQAGNFLPYYTKMLYFPQGVSLAYHNLALFNAYQGTLFHHLLNLSLPSAYNTVAVIAFLISALGMYALVKHLTRSPLAAFIAGIIFAFAPVHVSRLHFGHLEIFTGAQFIPLVALSIIRLTETHQWRYLIIGSFLIALIGWQSLDIARGTFLFASILLLLFGYQQNSKRWVMIQWLGMFFIVCIVMLPVAYPLVRDFAAFKDQVDQTAASIANSPDLINFFLPDRSISAFWRIVLGRFSSQPLTDFYQINGQRTVYLGLSVILLSIYSAIIVPFRQFKFWWVIAGIFFSLSLGPVLQVNGIRILSYMPYALLSNLPIIGLGREPARFGIFLMLVLGVLVGYGVTRVSQNSLRNMLLCAFIIPVIYIEFVATPVKMDDRLDNIPSYYREISQMSGTLSGGILDVPYDLYGSFGPACNYMVYQTVHQRPIVSGYISRAPKAAVKMLDGYPFVHQLRARIYGDSEPVHFSDKLIGKGIDELHKLNIDFVILHKSELSNSDMLAMRDAITKVVFLPIYEDNLIIVWRVPK
jgi:hypothetical protein